jgi:hypothetical protein
MLSQGPGVVVFRSYFEITGTDGDAVYFIDWMNPVSWVFFTLSLTLAAQASLTLAQFKESRAQKPTLLHDGSLLCEAVSTQPRGRWRLRKN